LLFGLDISAICGILISVMREIERRKELKKAWENIHPIDRPTWEQWKRGIFTLPETQKDRDFPIAAMDDRRRRAEQWANRKVA